MSSVPETLQGLAGSARLPIMKVGHMPAMANPLVALAVILLLQTTMLFGRAINWDEYWHYSLVHLFDQGVLYTPLQTFFIRLAQGLPYLPGDSVDHIIVARIAMFLCEIAAAVFVALLATRFTDRTIGALSALAYLSSAFVLQHGFSFRADPPLTALGMGALWVLGCTSFRGWWVVLFGLLLGLAGMFSIKIILYAPAFAGLAWLRWSEDGFRRAVPGRLIVATVVALLSFGLLYFYHSTAGVTVETTAGTVLSRSAQKMFVLGQSPYALMAAKFAILSLPFAAMILFFPLALGKARLSRTMKLALVGMFLPIATLAFYHNTAPYYYTFMLAPVAVACALPIAKAVHRYGVLLPTALLLTSGLEVWMMEDFRIIERQHALQIAAREMFPEKIAYFDFCAMLATKQKANVFMTPWGADLYRHGAVPSMTAVMARQPVPLIIENDPMFTRLLRSRQPAPEFLPDDAAALRDTYVHAWGPFWIAGRDVPEDGRLRQAIFLVPGSYTLSGGAVELDDRRIEPGQVVEINRGGHRLRAIDHQPARLLWGDHLHLPRESAPAEPMWAYF